MNVNEVLTIFNQELGEGVGIAIPTETTGGATKSSSESATTTTAAPAPQKVTSTRTVDVDGEGSNTLRTVIVGGILVLIALIIGVRGLIQKYEKEKLVDSNPEIATSKVVPLEDKKSDLNEEKSLTPPPADVAAAEAAKSEAETEAPAVKANESAKPAEPVKPEPPKVEAAKVEPPKAEPPKPEPVKIEAVAPAVGVPAILMKPEPPPAKPEAAKSEPAKTEKPAATEAVKEEASKAEAKGKKGQRHEVILEALDKVEVKFKLHGESKKLSLAPSQVHTIVVDEPITLDVSDAGALNITHNGHDKGPAGELGRPKQVSIP